MRLGRGRWRLGRWWFYFDTNLPLAVRVVGSGATYYSVACLVAEHRRPEGYANALREARFKRLVKHWQGIASQCWINSGYVVEQEPDETAEHWARRRYRHTLNAYELRAATARAQGEVDPPTLHELTVWAPGTFGIPTMAHTG